VGGSTRPMSRPRCGSCRRSSVHGGWLHRVCQARISRRSWGRTTSGRGCARRECSGAWPARTAMLPPGSNGSPLNGRARPVLGDPTPRGREPGGLAAAGVGRLELHCTHLLRSRSGGCRPRDLRVWRTSGDRSCPPLSTVCHSAADPARTSTTGPRLAPAREIARVWRHGRSVLRVPVTR
jgi:hypothetical protein